MKCLWHPGHIDEELPRRLVYLLSSEADASYLSSEGRSVVHRVRWGRESFVVRRFRADGVLGQLGRLIAFTPAWHEWRTGICLAQTEVPHVAPLAFLPGLFEQPIVYPDVPGSSLLHLIDRRRATPDAAAALGRGLGQIAAAGWVHVKMDTRKIIVKPDGLPAFIGLRYFQRASRVYPPARMLLRLWRSWYFSDRRSAPAMRACLAAAENACPALAEPSSMRETLLRELDLADQPARPMPSRLRPAIQDHPPVAEPTTRPNAPATLPFSSPAPVEVGSEHIHAALQSGPIRFRISQPAAPRPLAPAKA